MTARTRLEQEADAVIDELIDDGLIVRLSATTLKNVEHMTEADWVVAAQFNSPEVIERAKIEQIVRRQT